MPTTPDLRAGAVAPQSPGARVVSVAASVVVAALGLWAGLAVVGFADRVSIEELIFTALALLVAEVVARPFLRALAGRGSALLALLIGLLGQLTISGLVAYWVLGVRIRHWFTLGVVLMVMALITALGRWLVGASDTAYVVGHALRQRHRARSTDDASDASDRPDAAARGMLVVQLDGVSTQVLKRAMVSGQAPTVMRWLSEGTHVLREWRVPVPSTTPASQAGILHGDDTQVPGFRWWDRSLGRLMVSNRSVDAAVVESRFPPGQGLLRGGGVAVSTAFTGEASDTFLVFSRASRRGGLGPGSSYIPLFASPFLLPRTLLLTVGEMVKELYQARRQKVRGVQPRIHRKLSYVALRGITNVFLRTLNLVLVTDAMSRGAPAIFVDFVDYDEIAHHAGPERPEAMRALEGLDTVLGELARAAQQVAKPYDLVVWSDHGQSLGATFEQLAGLTLADRVEQLMDTDAVATLVSANGDDWGPLNALLGAGLSRLPGLHRTVELGPDRRQGPGGAAPAEPVPDVVVVGGGNLGMVWFPCLATRPGLGQVTQRWPGLIPGLALTEGIGAVLVADDEGAVVVGPNGVHRLATEEVSGSDPLAPYGPQAAGDLRRLSTMEHCGDLVLLSTVDLEGMVHAFEGQVGSHGGLGGPQNNGLLLHPVRLRVDDDLLSVEEGDSLFSSAVAIHDQIVRWRQVQGNLRDGG